jgi:hypothetical protein
LTHKAGFGSVFGYLLESYIYAKKNGFVFRVKNDDWQYGPEKGWHDYFESLEAYNPSEKNDREEPYTHARGPGKEEYTMGEYHEAIKEVYKPKEEITKAAKDFIGKIGGPYVAFYIRRGDKTSGMGKEMDAVDIGGLFKDSGVKGGNVFIMTDEYSAVEECKKVMVGCKIFTLTEQRNKGFSIHRIQEKGAEVRKKEAAELFTAIEVFHGCEKAWVDNRSNLGRFLKLRDLDKVHLYPSDDSNKNIPLEAKIHPPTKYLKA